PLKVDLLEANALISRVMNVAGRLLPVTITLEQRLFNGAVQLKADGAMLETALLNLVVNARDAMGGKPGLIRVSGRVHPLEGMASIAIEDQGPGMSDDLLQRATDPFFTTKAAGEGSGLGLSMVAGFADQSGGALRLENLEDGGLRAEIFLPAEIADP
ncbi:MAG: ATP-binding protein, partial [Pseudomonadota bacterium]